MKTIKIKQKILAFIIIGTIVVVNTEVVFFNDTSISLHSITSAFAFGESGDVGDDSWLEEQIWYRMNGMSCHSYTCIGGIEYESMCYCDYDIGICPIGSVDDCFDEGGRHQIGSAYGCDLVGSTHYPCSE